MNKLLLMGLIIVLVGALVLGGCAAPAPSPSAQPAPAPSPAPPQIAKPTPVSSPTPVQPSGSVADFYKGKTLTIICTQGVGGGTDLFARFTAPYLAALTGANVGVVNETAGGGMLALNKLSKMVKPDGLTILAGPLGGTWTDWAMGITGVEYDVTKFEYIGATMGGDVAYNVAPKGPYTSIEALQKATKPIRLGATGVTNSPTLAAIAASEALGLNTKIGIGYTAASRLLAMNQGELDASTFPIDSSVRYVKSGQSKILFLIAETRDKNFPDVPSLAELTKLSERHKTLLRGILAPSDRMFIAPPGTPEDRLQFLRDGFTTIFADKACQDAYVKVFEFWLGVRNSVEVHEMMLSMVKAKPDFVPLYAELIKKYVMQ